MSAPEGTVVRGLAITPKGATWLARDKRALAARRERAQRQILRRWATGELRDHAELMRLLRAA